MKKSKMTATMNQVKRRININIVLIGLIFAFSEVHYLWEGSSSRVKPFPFNPSFEYPTQWYVKLLCWYFQDVIKAVVIFRLSRMHQRQRIVARFYLILTSASFLMFALVYSDSMKLLVFIYPLAGMILFLSVIIDEMDLNIGGRAKSAVKHMAHLSRKFLPKRKRKIHFQQDIIYH